MISKGQETMRLIVCIGVKIYFLQGGSCGIFLGEFNSMLCFVLYEKQEKQDEPYLSVKNWSF